MIDKKLVLQDKEWVKSRLARKGYDVSRVDVLYDLLVETKSIQTTLEELRYKRNNDNGLSIEERRSLRDNISALNQKLAEKEKCVNEILMDMPNFPDDDAPLGTSEKDNVVIYEAEDYISCNVEEPLTHWELGEKLGILDFKLASKISGSMFALYKGNGSKLLRALINYTLTLHGTKYLEVTPPHVVTSQTLTYTGHLPKFAAEQYKAVNDDLWLIPTAEVPLTGCFAQTTFKYDELPQYRMAYTVCFRREAGSAGKDTRGLQRIHEFHKVELLKVIRPEDLNYELQDLLTDCQQIVKDLKLQYRIVDLCTGDMGDKYGRCYDIEVYSPGLKKWLEVSSVGHFSDYQARRAGIRYKDLDGKTKIAYTLNGSGVATPRIIAAILETYQQSDGSVVVPEVLVPFMGCNVIR